jgi:transmembrane sensor
MNQILKQASDWQARLQSPECSRSELEEFERWRNAAPEHHRAFTEVSILFSSLAELAATSPQLNEMGRIAVRQAVLAEPTNLPESQGNRHNFLARNMPIRTYALAASLTAMVIGLLFVVGNHVFRDTLYTTYTTAAGQVREVRLADGTVLNIDSDTVIRVSLRKDSRRVYLDKGRATLNVARDPYKPFTVLVGTREVVTVGTNFQMEQLDHQLLITLESGIIDVRIRS